MASLLARSSRDLRLMRLERTPRYSGSRACRTTRMKRRGRPVQANLNANYFYNIDNSQIAANLVSFFNPRNAGPGRRRRHWLQLCYPRPHPVAGIAR
jgi:hypothetical protein